MAPPVTCEARVEAALRQSYADVFADAIQGLEEGFSTMASNEKTRQDVLAGRAPVRDAKEFRENKSKFCAGDLRLAQLRTLLDSFEHVRSPDQVLFHEHFIKLCLPHIYGSDFEMNRMRLMKEFNLTEFKVGTLIMCPRRWGKTMSVVMFVAAMLLVCPHVTLATFSSGQRASTALKSKVLKELKTLPGSGDRVITNGEEQLAIANPSVVDGNGNLLLSKSDIRERQAVNRLFAYPASQKEQGG